jgi:predicted Zn-dependent peptidase
VVLRTRVAALDGRDAHEAADALGATLAGGTSQDGVALYASVESRRVAEARDLLLALGSGVELSDEDVDAERDVVLQEIARTADDPRESAHDLLYTAAFGDGPMGRPVLGTPESIAAVDAGDLMRFRRARWTHDVRSFAGAGNLERLSDGSPAQRNGHRPDRDSPFAPRALVQPLDLHQSYLRFWYELPQGTGAEPPERAWSIATVYATLLAGSLGSMLARELRHRAGLCYSLYGEPVWHRDARGLRIMMAVDPERAVEAVERTLGVLAGLGRDGAPESELERARAVAGSEFLLNMESTLGVVDHLLETDSAFGAPFEPAAAIAALHTVRGQDVDALAAAIAGAVPAFACIGPNAASELQPIDPGWTLLTDRDG